MRNTQKPLTTAQRATANGIRPIVAAEVGNMLTVAYTKRDGTEGLITGEVVGIVGHDSTEAVTLNTDKGFRSANLYAIKAVSA
jgi:hypothetical protein